MRRVNSGDRFSDEASIVLVGLPGVGKSTLGVIASASLKKRLIETDRCFYTMTGMTASEYLKAHGKEALLAREYEVLQQILHKHAVNSVIAVATRTSDIPSCRRLLERFADNHAVIHLVRHYNDIVQHLKARMKSEEIKRMYDRSLPLYRSVTNYEFFVHDSGFNNLIGRTPSFLSLKGMERDFLGFLRFISGKPRHVNFLLPPEVTEFSRILVTSYPQQDDIHDLSEVHGIHAIQLRLDFSVVRETDWMSLLNDISHVSATLRACCGHPLAFGIGKAVNFLTGTLIDEERYFALLDHAISLAFDYCYLDLRASRNNTIRFMKTTATTKIIATWHQLIETTRPAPSTWWTDLDCLSMYWTALDLGCSVLQMSAGTVNGLEDNFSAISFAQGMKQAAVSDYLRLSVFNTGDSGKLSRMMNRVLNPVILSARERSTIDDMIHSDPDLEGIITLQEAQQMMCRSFIVSGLKFCSFGSVISHSVGPAVQNAAFSALGLPYRYGVKESDDLNEALAFMRSKDFGGLSCANPHKQTMIQILDSISDHARAINAINTVYPHPNPSGNRPLLYGENTDWLGVVSCVKSSLSPINTVTSKTTALVIGTGGMARAAIYGLLHLGLTRVFIYSRTMVKSEELARRFRQLSYTLQREPRKVTTWSDFKPCVFIVLRFLDDEKVFTQEVCPPSIIINALTDGKEESVASAFDLPSIWFSRPTGGVYIEAAYKVASSKLREKVEGSMLGNWIFVGGRELYVEQALPQIELWTKMLGPRKIMRQVIGL